MSTPPNNALPGTFARAALVLTVVALSLFVLPLFITFSGIYIEGLGIFFVLYLLVAIPTTFVSIAASRRKEWRQPDGGHKLLCALYGLPVLIVAIVAAISAAA